MPRRPFTTVLTLPSLQSFLAFYRNIIKGWEGKVFISDGKGTRWCLFYFISSLSFHSLVSIKNISTHHPLLLNPISLYYLISPMLLPYSPIPLPYSSLVILRETGMRFQVTRGGERVWGGVKGRERGGMGKGWRKG